MTIKRLSLTNFRNHPSTLVEPDRHFILLTGPNGAGKTNVLEAVSLLAPGRGLRQTANVEMARRDGPGGFGVAARLDDATEIGTGTEPANPDRRIVRINGAAAAVNSLGERLSVLWLTPAMDRLFADSPGGRRRFLDRMTLALDPRHAFHAARYEAAMRARNKLLADPPPWDEEWLGALEAQMAEHGAAVTAARLATVCGLEASQSAGDFPVARLSLANATDGLGERLSRTRSLDASARRSTIGPNNEDLNVIFDGKDIEAARASTGEQKALLLGLILSHSRLVQQQRGAAPVLLLDEVAAHLDPARREALYDQLRAGGQVWMTGTENALFDAIEPDEATRIEVADGSTSEH